MKIKQKRDYKFLKGIITLIIFIAVIAAVGLYAFKQLTKPPAEVISSFDGVVACLPLKSVSDQPEGATCKKGLKDKDESYYVLKGISLDILKVGDTIHIKGVFEPVNDDADDDMGEYMIAGTIVKK